MKTLSHLFSIKKSLSIISFFFAAGAAFTANASNYNPRTNPFERSVSEFETQCSKDCGTKFRVEKQRNFMPTELRSLIAIATQQAQIWGDTILEGDYYAAGNTKLEFVDRIYKDNQLIAYRITYSETAWDTSNCRFNSYTKAGLETCKKGRILESGYVSPDFKNAFTDLNHLAEFVI